MPCEHVRVPLNDGTVATAIVCFGRGRRTKTKPCQFCGNRSTKLCDWKCERPEKINPWNLKADDVVVTQQKGYRLPVQGLQRFEGTFRYREVNGKPEITTKLDRYPEFPIVTHKVTMYGLVFPDGKCWLYYHIAGDKTRLQVLRPGTCDTPCCDLHSRQVDDDVDYCRDHWQSWEER